MRCGKLLNFGPDSVDGKLVATRLTPEVRRQFTVDATRWREINLRKLLALTPLTALQWVNLDHANIQFTTLTR